ncbi:hypothetical protein GGR56DRAFT_671413 [Xylariaceae sp. FL0804]|nr:hypothetical protein GGR56DRAFT_671413 [Xylariaceae sp. FL0804]
MSTFSNLIVRGKSVLVSRSQERHEPDAVINLMIAFLGIAFMALLLYNDIKHDNGCHTRRLTIQTAGRQSILVLNGGRPMLADPAAPPHSPGNIPKIHITFPDEQDEYGHPKKGNVVVVRVGETSVGLEPLNEEQLPAYEKEGNSGFYSIDMDKIGGLKEKDHSQFS